MRNSPCCKAPAATHGARRRRCTTCNATWTPRPRKRGRHKKRARMSLAETFLQCNFSLRGLAKRRHHNREVLRKRLHRSMACWLRHRSLAPLPPSGALIAVTDALWFSFGKTNKKFGCFAVLLRPIHESRAHLAALLLRSGKEGRKDWEAVFGTLPKRIRQRIVALVSDGYRGSDNLARLYGWHFQWCHAHMKRKMAELRGVRNLPGKQVRQRVTALLYTFLETPLESEAQQCLEEIITLLDSTKCPQSLKDRLRALKHKSHLFRTYRRAPELNLPVTTNSVEAVNRHIRERLSRMRGVRSPKALRYWLKVIQMEIATVQCRGYQETVKFYRKSMS